MILKMIVTGVLYVTIMLLFFEDEYTQSSIMSRIVQGIIFGIIFTLIMELQSQKSNKND